MHTIISLGRQRPKLYGALVERWRRARGGYLQLRVPFPSLGPSACLQQLRDLMTVIGPGPRVSSRRGQICRVVPRSVLGSAAASAVLRNPESVTVASLQCLTCCLPTCGITRAAPAGSRAGPHGGGRGARMSASPGLGGGGGGPSALPTHMPNVMAMMRLMADFKVGGCLSSIARRQQIVVLGVPGRTWEVQWDSAVVWLGLPPAAKCAK